METKGRHRSMEIPSPPCQEGGKAAWLRPDRAQSRAESLSWLTGR